MMVTSFPYRRLLIFDSDSLLFLGNFFTDAEFLWQSARWTDPTIHYS